MEGCTCDLGMEACLVSTSTGIDVVFALCPEAFNRVWSSPTPGTAFSLPVACECPGNAGPLVNEANLSLRHFHS